MLRLSLLLILLTHRTRTAYVTDSPSYADRLDMLYEKLERFSLAPPTVKKSSEKLYEKLDRLNSLMPEKDLTDDDEELLAAMQMWSSMSDEQLQSVVQDLQSIKEDKSERLTDSDYGDGDWNDDDMEQELADGDYANDVGEEWDPLEDDTSSTRQPVLGVTPSAIIRRDKYRHTIISAVDPIAATNERPRILDDSHGTAEERVAVRRAALANIGTVVRAGKCLIPQPRWLTVRKLAPAAGTVYMPPCVQLHRCAPDSGCCHNENEVCAPVDGQHIATPFLLSKADGSLQPARIMFFNHTSCACVPRDTLETTARVKIERPVSEERDSMKDKQNDWRSPTEEPRLERDEEQTSPPQLRGCTCPVLFKSRVTDGVCSCTCDWVDATRRRDCQLLSRGHEHFGLRARMCVSLGTCNPPSCDHGHYETKTGKCPSRRFKRRYNMRMRYQPQKIVV